MKILHLLSQIPEATGSGIYLQAAMRHASGRGFHNYLLAGIPVDFPEEQRFQQLHCNDYCVVRFEHDLPFPVVGMSDVMPYPSSRFCDLSEAELEIYEGYFTSKLIEAVERWQPDLIHAHHLWLLTSLARRQFPEIPLLATCHGSDLRQFRNCAHLQGPVLSGCRQVSAVCALNRVQKEEIRQLYAVDAGNVHVVGAGYDHELFYRSGERGNGPVQILYAGKLSYAKGVPWLLRSLANLSAGAFIFHLVGDGSGAEKQDILQLADGLGEQVLVHGKLDQRQLAELMRQADLFVLPSFFEGLPLVLLEAMASGCHIVATALPGVVELFSVVESDWVELVALPQMASIDLPHPAEEGFFVSSLTAAITKQLLYVRSEAEGTDLPEDIAALLESYTWEEIFLKIEQLYKTISV